VYTLKYIISGRSRLKLLLVVYNTNILCQVFHNSNFLWLSTVNIIYGCLQFEVYYLWLFTVYTISGCLQFEVYYLWLFTVYTISGCLQFEVYYLRLFRVWISSDFLWQVYLQTLSTSRVSLGLGDLVAWHHTGSCISGKEENQQVFKGLQWDKWVIPLTKFNLFKHVGLAWHIVWLTWNRCFILWQQLMLYLDVKLLWWVLPSNSNIAWYKDRTKYVTTAVQFFSLTTLQWSSRWSIDIKSYLAVVNVL